MGSEMPNSPVLHEITMSRPANQWRRVTTDDIKVYAPQDAPVKALETISQQIVFGRVETVHEGTDESAEVEGAGRPGKRGWHNEQQQC